MAYQTKVKVGSTVMLTVDDTRIYLRFEKDGSQVRVEIQAPQQVDIQKL